MREANVAERRRNPPRLIEFRWFGHGARRIDEQIDRQVLFLVEQPEQQPVQALCAFQSMCRKSSPGVYCR